MKKWMDKQIMTYSYHRILFSNKKEEALIHTKTQMNLKNLS